MAKMIFAGKEGGRKSPSLLGHTAMVSEVNIAGIVNDFLEGSDQFLVAVKVTPQNKIMVFIDGDSGVSIADCVRLSRHIESLLDRDVADFELDVSSVGVGYPLRMTRQYRNNIGRRLAIKDTEGEKVSGKLVEVDEKGVTLEKDKPRKGKKNQKEPETDAGNTVYVPFEQIHEARVQVSFK
ncbi:MAG: ribosome assembly cofactor RimP [Bacteroidales bacterium]